MERGSHYAPDGALFAYRGAPPMIDFSLARLGESCVGNDTIVAYVGLRLQAAAKSEVDRHITHCEPCRRALSEVVRGDAPRPSVIADTVVQWSVEPSLGASDDVLVFAAVGALIAAASAVLWQLL